MSPRAAPARTEALVLLRLIVDTLHRSARAVERRTGVTNAQLFLLQQLGEGGPLSVTALAARARTNHSTVSTVVRRLERAKLATRTRSPDDGRSVLISIAPAGRRLLRTAPAAPTADVLRALARLSDDQARALARALRALVRTLRLARREPTMLFEEPAPRRRRG